MRLFTSNLICQMLFSFLLIVTCFILLFPLLVALLKSNYELDEYSCFHLPVADFATALIHQVNSI